MTKELPPVVAPRPRLIVAAEHFGPLGGGARAAMLLGDSLARLQVSTLVLTTAQPEEIGPYDRRYLRILRSPINVGWRFGLPMIGATLTLSRLPRLPILGAGMTRFTGWVLRLRPRKTVWIWEMTDALRPSWAIDDRAFRGAGKAAGFLAPSAIVEANLRATYSFDGVVARLRFWAEGPTGVFAPPEEKIRRRFLFLGRLIPEKGLSELLEAFAASKLAATGGRLTLAGSGQVEVYRQQADRLGLGDAVHLKGRFEESELDGLVRDHGWIVLPSRSEGYPLSPLEALGRGRPVVTTRVGSIPEIYEGEPCVWLIPPRDVPALTAALRAAAAEPRHAELCAAAPALFERLSGRAVVDAEVAAALAAMGVPVGGPARESE